MTGTLLEIMARRHGSFRKRKIEATTGEKSRRAELRAHVLRWLHHAQGEHVTFVYGPDGLYRGARLGGLLDGDGEALDFNVATNEELERCRALAEQAIKADPSIAQQLEEDRATILERLPPYTSFRCEFYAEWDADGTLGVCMDENMMRWGVGQRRLDQAMLEEGQAKGWVEIGPDGRPRLTDESPIMRGPRERGEVALGG